MKDTLEIDSVILEFGSQRILQDVYLKSEIGKVIGLLGRNGSGKSCLLKVIFGELEQTNKSFRINGNTILGNSRNPKDLRYLPQRRFIPKSLTLKRIFKDFDLDFNNFVYEFPDFEKFYTANLKKLSGGERRIVEIYSILVSKTKFSLLDEPFSQVMPVQVEILKKLILKEKETKGILVTDHLYKDIIDICDYIYVIKEGKMHLTHSLKDLEVLEYVKINGD